MSTPQMPTTPVPPPHPYTQATNGRTNNGFAISAMATGLLALLTIVVAIFYGFTLVYVAIAFAVIAIGLGITALVLKQRPLAMSIVGLASAAVSILAGAVIGLLVIAGTVTAAADRANNSSDSRENWPQPSQGINAEWPSNMASGSVTFLGGADIGSKVARSEAPNPGATPTEQTLDSATNHIQLYVDYMCPICSRFEQTNQSTIEAALADSNTVLEVRPLTFLDRVSEGSYYSSRASAALACVADSQPKLAWQAHTALLDPENQPEEGTTGLSNEQLIDTLDEATGGLNETTQKCITDETYVPFAQGLNSWLFSNPVPQAEDPNLMVSGTPTVVVNGVPYTGKVTDAAAFKSFLEQQGVTLK